jgi:hypothetical protein
MMAIRMIKDKLKGHHILRYLLLYTLFHSNESGDPERHSTKEIKE